MGRGGGNMPRGGSPRAPGGGMGGLGIITGILGAPGGIRTGLPGKAPGGGPPRISGGLENDKKE
jgi:hypothetical protein